MSIAGANGCWGAATLPIARAHKRSCLMSECDCQIGSSPLLTTCLKFTAIFIAGYCLAAFTLERAGSRLSAYIEGCTDTILKSDSDYSAVAAVFVYTNTEWTARSTRSVASYGPKGGQQWGGATVSLVVSEKFNHSSEPHRFLWEIDLSSCGQIIDVRKLRELNGFTGS
jgi:hypothetical protein